ncbi:TadE/TadG family type IV pilus assembly protein [Actinoplanes sp. G11-F43]|uniref:TadE/TadG family type IV pilus assembly protein n=1 Tax=Actinoplanes sp. G11-F43 TaxID=3424130 RepID=UPI003D34D727
MRHDDGGAALEYVIVVPVVLAVMFLAIQVAMYSYARSIALTAAQEGLTAARAYDGSAGAGSERARSFIDRAAGDSLTGTRVSVSRAGEQATVTVTGRSLSLVPGISGFNVSQSAVGPVERWTQ